MRSSYLGISACLWVWPVAAEQGRLSASLIEATPERAVAEGDVELRWSGHRFMAERLVVEEAAEDVLRFEATDFLWTPCSCEATPWAISGRSAEGVLDDHVIIRRGTFRVCDVPVLPVPFLRVPLDRRAPRVLIPELRVGEAGSVVGVPLWLPIGEDGHAILTSEWWSRRWLRQRAEIDVPLGTVNVAVAKDEPAAPTRAQVDVLGSHDGGEFRAGADVGWASDKSVRADYESGFIARNTLFDERLMFAGVGPVRIESDTFDRGARQRPISAVVSFGGLALGPSSLSTYGRVDNLRDADDARRQVAAGGVWSMGIVGDWTEVSAQGVVEAVQSDDGQPYTRAGAGGSFLLPLWADFGRYRVISQAGVEGWLDADEGELSDPFGLVHRRPQWAIGPAQYSQWVNASGIPLRWSAALLWTELGWRPQGTLNIDHRGLGGTIHADTDVQAGMVGVQNEGMDTQVGVLHDGLLLQGLLRGSFRVARYWRPGWSGMYDFEGQRFVRHGPNLRWDPGCGCITANLEVEWAQDLSVPSVMLRLDLHARRSADR